MKRLSDCSEAPEGICEDEEFFEGRRWIYGQGRNPRHIPPATTAAGCSGVSIQQGYLKDVQRDLAS